MLCDTTCPCLCLLFSCLVLVLSCLVCSLCHLGHRVAPFFGSLAYLVLSGLCVVLKVVWGHFWSSWGSFRVIFGRLGGRFGLLGWSWGALGRSWRLLARSWWRSTPPVAGGINWLPLSSRCLDASWAPKGRQDGPQNDQKAIKSYIKKRSHFGSVLRPSWGDPGSI